MAIVNVMLICRPNYQERHNDTVKVSDEYQCLLAKNSNNNFQGNFTRVLSTLMNTEQTPSTWGISDEIILQDALSLVPSL